MIQLIPQLRILLACQPVDFRNGIDGLASVCKRALEEDPFSGALFVFRNRRGTALKLLCYDGIGFWLVIALQRLARSGWLRSPLAKAFHTRSSGRARFFLRSQIIPRQIKIRIAPRIRFISDDPRKIIPGIDTVQTTRLN